MTARRAAPEPVEVTRQRRDQALATLVAGVPYITFLGVRFERRGDELTAIMPYASSLIGNPAPAALHGGATAAFLEMTAIISLGWAMLWPRIEGGGQAPGAAPALPKTIDFTIDYLRAGLPRDAYARARVTRVGRRYASVQSEAWQDNRDRPIAQAAGHFLMPPGDG
ncbi:PaaI family thioesterase [Roseovarius dicentrarchi]|uniref:PaaI family thioesterase n=1 Tax=Roseovarius dicentrarchi TaxID=2250573 RepID=UPI000DEAB2D9|nr:PaaI family thioesterase [Roseovarius dicentrarchi]